MICLHCNKALISSKKKPKKFCNANCRTRYYYNKKYKAVRISASCIVCSKLFQTLEKQQGRFCSNRCKNFHYYNPNNPENFERINKKIITANNFYLQKMKELGDKREKEGLPRVLKRKFNNENERQQKKKEYAKEYKQRDYVKVKTKIYLSREDVKKSRNQLVKNWFKTKEGSEYRKEYTKKLWAKKGEELKAKARSAESRTKILKRYHERKKIDIQFKITRVLRSRLTSAVRSYKKKNVILKKGKTLDLLGCTMDIFLKHIESQFSAGMDWNNHGLQSYNTKKRWNIDHIKPIDKFDLTKIEDQKKCFHYTNLQPLWQKDNRRKWNK